jgi:hypothetical protein
MKIIISESQYKILNEQLGNFGYIRNVKKLRKDWKTDVLSNTERGIKKIKQGLDGADIKDIVNDLSKKKHP